MEDVVVWDEAGFPAPISFRFAYFYHAFPVNKYPRNSLARTYQFGVLDNESLIRAQLYGLGHPR